jgi:hypothetical protein
MRAALSLLSLLSLCTLPLLLGGCDGREPLTLDSGSRPDSGPPRHKGVLVRWTIEGSNNPALCKTFKIESFFYGMALFSCPAGNRNHTDGMGIVECSDKWEAYLGNDFCNYSFGLQAQLLDGETFSGPQIFGELLDPQQTITEDLTFSYEELCAQLVGDKPAQCR